MQERTNMQLYLFSKERMMQKQKKKNNKKIKTLTTENRKTYCNFSVLFFQQ